MVLAHDVHEKKRTQDIHIPRDVTFESMLISPNTLQGLKGAGFHKPSPVQLHGIPLGKCGFDLLMEAKSGTGKTAVFTVIALEKLDLSKDLQVLVLTPTREIAAQTCDVIKQIGSNHEGLQIEVVMGGLSVQEDIMKFRNKVHIVVGSPGRLRHLIQDKHIDISAVRLFILDEADKLMEKSFESDVKYIYNILPKQKQVILSSATYPEHTKTFMNSYVQNAQHICPDSNCVLLGVNQKTTLVRYNSNIVRQTQNRFEELLKILTNTKFKQCLIFCNYQVRVTELHKLLTRKKWPAEQLYGQQEQTVRLDALKTLQDYKCRILISTDLAARGIDASNVDLVVNFEPPQDWQTYLHRIGRAGRFGSYGTSITILCEGKELEKFKSVLGPLEESMNITDLWSCNQLNLNTKFPSVVSNTTLNNLSHEGRGNYCKTLWNMLTNVDRANEKQDLENFENLCKSFDDSYKIESFEDLLQNFEKCKHDDKEENNIYKYIEMPAIPFEIFPVRNKINQSSNVSKDQLADDTAGKNTCYISDTNKSTTDSFSDEIINLATINSRRLLQKKRQNKLNNEKKKFGKYLRSVNNEKKSSFQNDQNITSEMKKSNLRKSMLVDPQLIAECPLTNNNKKYNYKKCFENKHYEISSYINQSEDVDYTNYNLHEYYDCHSQTNMNRKSICGHGYSSKVSYFNWYKQLKLQIKQIELSIYVHEMTKM